MSRSWSWLGPRASTQRTSATSCKGGPAVAAGALRRGQLVLHALHRLALQTHLDHRVDQVSRRRVLKRGLEKGPLQVRHHVRNQDNQAGVQVHLSVQMDEIRTVVGHKGEFVFDGPLRQRPIGRAAQAENRYMKPAVPDEWIKR